MIDQSKVGTDWSADELDAIVAEYFAMLSAQSAGQTFVKAQRARALDARIGRGAKSIEFKHMNISAVLTELGMPIIRGYRPMTNYQRAIFPALERYLDAHPAAWNLGLPLSSPFHGEGDHEVVEGATPPSPAESPPPSRRLRLRATSP